MLRVSLMCVGRTKVGAERELEARYLGRAKASGRSIGLDFEIFSHDESRARRPEDRRAEEAEALRASIPTASTLVVFDERGQGIDSPSFAAMIGNIRDQGVSDLALIIGGPDGIDSALCHSAFRSLALGVMTWPHQLVRIMACEQLYRAVTILIGHPYHRG